MGTGGRWSLSTRGGSSHHPELFKLEENFGIILRPTPLRSLRDEENEVQGHLVATQLAPRLLCSRVSAPLALGVAVPALFMLKGLGRLVSGVGFLGSGNGIEMPRAAPGAGK